MTGAGHPDGDRPGGECGEGESSGAARSRRAVRSTYDAIADHFASTRAHPWPEVESFLDGRSGRLGLDVGCGNGRHAGPLTERVDRVLGVDASVELLALARERAAERGFADAFDPVAGDAAGLPVRSGTVDLAVYVATLHHLPTRSLRRESLSELGRVLAPGGAALVSAWSTAHDRFDAGTEDSEGFDTTVDWTLPGGETVPRFYHIYAPAEFDADLAAASLAVERSVVSSGNCYAVVNDPDGFASRDASQREHRR
ncbi:MAG: class I SAM-dependent methyltransferase [Haloarculaceae archaeon]